MNLLKSLCIFCFATAFLLIGALHVNDGFIFIYQKVTDGKVTLPPQLWDDKTKMVQFHIECIEELNLSKGHAEHVKCMRNRAEEDYRSTVRIAVAVKIIGLLAFLFSFKLYHILYKRVFKRKEKVTRELEEKIC